MNRGRGLGSSGPVASSIAGTVVLVKDLGVPRSRGQGWPVALIVGGAIVIVVGSLGLALGWGDTESGPRGSAAAASSSTTPTTNASEQPAAFLAAFVQALRGGDANFLVNRLVPEVIARYGEHACRTSIHNLFDATAALTLRSTTGPATFAYAGDGKSVAVPDVYTFTVDGTVGGQSATRQYHLALIDGRFHIFLDCGSPLPGAP